MSIKVKSYKNGATVVYRHRKRKHTSVVAGFVFGRNRDRHLEPVAHFLEHMFFKETESRNEKQLRQNMLDTFSIYNGHTNLFYTEIDFCRANKAIKPCFALASDMLLQTKFSKKLIETEKGVIKQELVKKLNDPNAATWFAKVRTITNEYNKNTNVLGSEEEILAINSKTLQKFRDETFISENFIISIEGGISFFKAKHLAEKYFIKNLKSNHSYCIDRTIIPDYNRTGNMNVETFPFNKANCSITIKLDKNMESPKTEQTIRMLKMICNGPSGKMFTALRDKGLVYSANLNSDCITDHFILEAQWTCSSENVNACIDEIGKVFKDLKQNQVDEKLLEKKKENARLSKDEQSPANITFSNLFRNFLFFDRKVFTRKYKKDCKKIFESLTAFDIQNFCKEVFSKPENIYVAILTGQNHPEFYSYEKIQQIITEKNSSAK